MQYKIILASNSPRRKELLKGLDIDFEVRIIPDIDESYPAGLMPDEVPLYIARKKAEAYKKSMNSNELIITADTVVILDDVIMEKPSDRNDAITMLRRLSGRKHRVITAVALTTIERSKEFAVCSEVDFAELTNDEIIYYVDKYKPFDKAGAYGIQEWIGYVGVRGIEGSFYNVMGMPVQRLYREMKSFEKKKKTLPMLENVEIIDIAAEGNSLARAGEMVVFIPFGAPGDIVDIQLVKKRRNYAEGRIVNFRKYSDIRQEPFCEHFTLCGGCKWQHIPYDMQLAYKQKQVIDNLTRIGKVELPEISPVIGSEQTVCYRNKLEFSFTNRRWLTENEIENDSEHFIREGLGYHIPAKFDKVFDVRKCWLQDDISNRIRLFIRQFCLDNGYSFFDLRNQEGFMRNIIIRTSSSGEVMLIVIFYAEDKTKREKLLNELQATFPEITSLMYVINSKCNDTITDQTVLLYSGKDHLTEQMEDLKFKISPKSFYQTNSRQAYKLYCIVRDFALLQGNEIVYDLYTGTGTIANFIAKNCRKVIGIEYVNEAIEDAVVNSQINGITNTEFFAGDMKDILTTEFVARHGKPDVIITDPPRSGMHDDVTDTIIAAAPNRIVYVSCNPATQARDLNRLDAYYCIRKIQPVDMFPHTHHIENVALLEKR